MKIIELFKELIQRKSETPDDGEILNFISRYLDDYSTLVIDIEDVKNIFIYKKFSEGPHLCFAGHVDVVPAGDGWDSDPYKPIEKDGYIFGRGTQDMKSGVAAFVQALRDTKNFKGTLSVLLTSDEEGPAKNGTVKVLELLEKKELLPDACIVAEPTCEEKFGDAMKVGRRGSVNGVIEVIGRQGHAAYPEKAVNPIEMVSKVLDKIAGVNLDSGDKYFSASKFVITDIRSGMEVTNVTPGTLKMMFNVRNSTKTEKKDIEAFVDKYFKDMNYSLKLDQSAYPFVTKSDTRIVKTLDRSIEKITGIKPKHSTAGGTSDARFIAPYGIDVVEFGVINDTIHAPNERTTKNEVEQLYKIFIDLIKSF